MRRLAIWLAWENLSDYYSAQLADALQDEYETTITRVKVLDPDPFDVVLMFFAHYKMHCAPEKVAYLVWEPHEFGRPRVGSFTLASTEKVFKALKGRPRLLRVCWGVNTEDFYPQPFPKEPLTVGWCGLPQLDRKQYYELEAAIEAIDGVRFLPNRCQTRIGRTFGAYEMEEMGQYYAKIHIYACASWNEGFGFPLLEATACGRPVVTFDVGIARELQETGAGIIIVKDFKEMQEAITSLDYRKLGQQSAEAIESHWLWKHVKDSWLEVLAQVGVKENG